MYISSTLKLFLFVFLGLGYFFIAESSVEARGPCEDACLNEHNGCLTVAQQDYDMCLMPGTIALMNCENDADSAYNVCLDNCGGVSSACYHVRVSEISRLI